MSEKLEILKAVLLKSNYPNEVFGMIKKDNNFASCVVVVTNPNCALVLQGQAGQPRKTQAQ